LQIVQINPKKDDETIRQAQNQLTIELIMMQLKTISNFVPYQV